MPYTVKEVSALSGVTVKTLHHYHKIGLLLPCEISEAGYRLYGMKELERLQQILFYRELDLPLARIKLLLEGEPDRAAILSEQKALLHERKQRLETMIQTLEKSIRAAEKGETMNGQDMFKGFASEEEWKEALREQDRHLQQNYGVRLVDDGPIDVPQMNEQAAEAAAFMNRMAQALRENASHLDDSIQSLIAGHLAFLNEHGHTVTAADFAGQTKFFLSDEFHRNMLENQQTGLAYYLYAAAEAFASRQ
ncbi:MerR family transcriptional regulator [Paenibacillus macerans]|uniref:MerR family transcriptional regulator n=1 Tax=Paenibacillus macerans TaxID=44252 RepID=UPI002E1F8138|nr:MerR family transcriptional regulator [Paenibacillus macerans]